MVSDILIKLWLMGDAQFNNVPLIVGTGWQAALPANPQRYALLLGSNTAGTVNWAWSDSANISPQGNVAFQTGQQPLVVTFDELGLAMQLPLWVKAGVASTSVNVLEVTWSNTRYHMAMRWVDEYFSQYATS